MNKTMFNFTLLLIKTADKIFYTVVLYLPTKSVLQFKTDKKTVFIQHFLSKCKITEVNMYKYIVCILQL